MKKLFLTLLFASAALAISKNDEIISQEAKEITELPNLPAPYANVLAEVLREKKWNVPGGRMTVESHNETALERLKSHEPDIYNEIIGFASEEPTEVEFEKILDKKVPSNFNLKAL